MNLNTGNEVEDIPTAVDNADPYDTLRVGTGTFDLPGDSGDHRTLDVEGLTLEGPNAGIAGDSNQRGTEATINGPLMIGADNVTVDGVEINDDDANSGGPLPGPGALQFAMGSGYGDTADNATVKNNVIIGGKNSNNTNAVLAFKAVDDVVVERNQFDEENAAVEAIAFGGPVNAELTNNTDNTTGSL